MHRTIVLAVALVLGMGSATAAAQEDNSHQLDEAARLTFQSAREAFVAGDYERALNLFRQAHNLSQRPGLLYNIAQTLDRLRRDEETVAALRQYLAASPDAHNRAEVEARIRVLDESLARRHANDPDPVPDPDPNATGEPAAPSAPAGDPLAIAHPAVFISLAGVALASAAVTIWAGLDTIALNDRYVASTPEQLAQAENLYSRASNRQLLTNVFIGTTIAFGLGAVALAIITDWGVFTGDSDQASNDVRPLLGVGPNGGTLGLGGQF